MESYSWNNYNISMETHNVKHFSTKFTTLSCFLEHILIQNHGRSNEIKQEIKVFFLKTKPLKKSKNS